MHPVVVHGREPIRYEEDGMSDLSPAFLLGIGAVGDSDKVMVRYHMNAPFNQRIVIVSTPSRRARMRRFVVGL